MRKDSLADRLLPRLPRQEVQGLKPPLAPAPAEKLKREEYRQRDSRDIWPVLLWCGISGALPALLVVAIKLAQRDPWLVPLAVFVGTMTLAWLCVAWCFFDDALLVTVTETLKRMTGHALDGDGLITVRGQTQVAPRRLIYTEFRIKKPLSFHQFCKDVHAGRCLFSETAAKGYDLASDWASIYGQWTRQRLLIPQGRRKAPMLTDNGRAMVETFATTPPYSPTPAATSD